MIFRPVSNAFHNILIIYYDFIFLLVWPYMRWYVRRYLLYHIVQFDVLYIQRESLYVSSYVSTIFDLKRVDRYLYNTYQNIIYQHLPIFLFYKVEIPKKNSRIFCGRKIQDSSDDEIALVGIYIFNFFLY